MILKTFIFSVFIFLLPCALISEEIKELDKFESLCPDLKKFDDSKLKKMEKKIFALELDGSTVENEKIMIDNVDCDHLTGDCYFIFGSELCGFNVGTKESWTGYRDNSVANENNK